MYEGVSSDPRFIGRNLVIVDAGGGSTELVAGRQHHLSLQKSLPLGTVRLLEHHGFHDPPTKAEWLSCEAQVRSVLEEEIAPVWRELAGAGGAEDWRLVAASGSATILARMEKGADSYDRSILDGVVLTASRLHALREQLWSLDLEHRRRLAGMPYDRADVMLTGVAIYAGVVQCLGFTEMEISLRGLRFGALLHREGGGGLLEASAATRE
jgi:exopolyphosphatase/guanosine-5'-triphosphate,3'-diphosphate pyrophosphatase